MSPTLNENNELEAEGIAINLGKKTYVLPPLPLAKMHVTKRMMSGGDFAEDPDYAASVVDSIFHSLRRNYKTLDRSVVEDNLDMLNIQTVMKAFQEVNGFVVKKDEIQPEPGNTTAG
jgi:hypothetical protein